MNSASPPLDSLVGAWRANDGSSVKVVEENGSVAAYVTIKKEITLDGQGRPTCDGKVLQSYSPAVIGWGHRANRWNRWTWQRNWPHAPFLRQIEGFCEDELPFLTRDHPVLVPVWAFEVPSASTDFDFYRLERLWRRPDEVKAEQALSASLEEMDGKLSLRCRNPWRLEVLRCVQLLHVNKVLKVKCRITWHVSDSTFLGKWEDDDNSKVEIWWNTRTETLVAYLEKEGLQPRWSNVKYNEEHGWTCRDWVLEVDQSNPGRLVWLGKDGSGKRVWRRPKDYYAQHAPLMPDVSQFCESVRTMEPSGEPVWVPVLALRFTQYNINRNLNFCDGRPMLDMLSDLMQKPDPGEGLEPLEVYRYTGPDGVPALYSANNRRLVVWKMFQAIRPHDVVQIRCRIYDPEIQSENFQSKYSKPGQFEGCDGLGLEVWVRE